jgi:hypothetical protein
MVVRYDNEPLRSWDKVQQELLSGSDRWSEQEPERFAVFNGYLELYPIPSEDADTIKLESEAGKAATEFMVNSVSGFKDQGRGKIENEVFSWTNIDSTNLKLQGIERGLEGTMAATHGSGATITERNIEWFGGLYPKKYFARPGRSATLAGSVNVSAVTDGVHIVYLTFYSTKWQSESLSLEIGSLNASGQQIDISNIPSSDDNDIDYVRIYMTSADGTTIYFVDEVANGTATYSITTADLVLLANAVYTKTESDVPWNYRDVESDLAIAQWFIDNEQFERWRQRKNSAYEKMGQWLFSLETEMGGGYGFMGD